jgi:hypothetical protein
MVTLAPIEFILQTLCKETSRRMVRAPNSWMKRLMMDGTSALSAAHHSNVFSIFWTELLSFYNTGVYICE